MSATDKKKHPKMDPLMVSKQPWEISHVVTKMHKEGHTAVTGDLVKEAVKTFKGSRRKIYAYLRTL